jgi:hypothetical protein
MHLDYNTASGAAACLIGGSFKLATVFWPVGLSLDWCREPLVLWSRGGGIGEKGFKGLVLTCV